MCVCVHACECVSMCVCAHVCACECVVCACALCARCVHVSCVHARVRVCVCMCVCALHVCVRRRCPLRRRHEGRRGRGRETIQGECGRHEQGGSRTASRRTRRSLPGVRISGFALHAGSESDEGGRPGFTPGGVVTSSSKQRYVQSRNSDATFAALCAASFCFTRLNRPSRPFGLHVVLPTAARSQYTQQGRLLRPVSRCQSPHCSRPQK